MHEVLDDEVLSLHKICHFQQNVLQRYYYLLDTLVYNVNSSFTSGQCKMHTADQG